MKSETKREKRHRRHKRIRSKVFGTTKRPRLCVFRSSQHIYCQVIDDGKNKTLFSASDQEFENIKSKGKKSKIDIAKEIGKLVAKKALEKDIKEVIFDRGGYQYHGRVKALAEGAREGGLKF